MLAAELRRLNGRGMFLPVARCWIAPTFSVLGPTESRAHAWCGTQRGSHSIRATTGVHVPVRGIRAALPVGLMGSLCWDGASFTSV